MNFPKLRVFLAPLILLSLAQAMPGLAAINLKAVSRQTSASLCPAQLTTAIDAVINRPQFRRARWGILVEPLSDNATNRPLYSHDAQRYFIPASNVKLLTTAAALLQLGASYQIRTSVDQVGTNSLRVVGRGDPSLTVAQLIDLAQQLKRQGIKNVQELIVDDGYFQGDSVNLTWDWQDVQSDYGASVNSLILNQNAVELTLSPQQVGQPLRITWADAIASSQWQVENNSLTTVAANPTVTVTAVLGKPILQINGQLAVDAKPEVIGLPVLNSGEYFLQHFRQVLASQGINVVKGTVGTNATSERELASIESPPLATLIVETNQESNNLYAEALLRTLATRGGSNSTELGLQQLKQTLTALGVDPESYMLVDGSGLSRQNLVSPEAIAKTLKGMATTPLSSIYRASLSTAGVNGTLRQRFLSTSAQGNLQAKTGTLTGVSALSGYLNVPDYQPLVFSLMVNQSEQSSSIQRQAIDEIVLLLARLRSC